jgi:hypothetical protein
MGNPQASWAVEGNTDVDDFLRTGGVAMPMGVSGQAGKSKPETGVFLRYVRIEPAYFASIVIVILIIWPMSTSQFLNQSTGKAPK